MDNGQTEPGKSKDERNKELVKRYQAGDKSALEKLCASNYGFVKMKAQACLGAYGSDLTEEDLVQEGFIGLIKAAENADPDREETFLTYAGWHVYAHMSSANINQGFAIRIPVNTMQEVVRLSKADTLYQHLHGSERILALAEHLGVSVGRIIELLKISDYLHLARADKPMDSNDEDLRLKDFFRYNPENSFDNIDENLEKEELAKALATAMECLSERERDVILLRFGFINGEEYTLETIGRWYGLSRDRIRQIEAKALRKMRGRAKTNRLKEFV